MNASYPFDIELEPERYELRDAFFDAERTRREFFRIAGAGVIVALLVGEEASAQPKGGNAPRDIGAWIHIGEDSTVTVYTGKVEIGQNIRTSLTQVVAEELRAPVKSIRVVMADTALVPFDAGTFGSRTTPAMASQLRRAAAAARETLLDLAAEQSKAERESLAAPMAKSPDRTASLRSPSVRLTKGQKLMKVIAAGVPTTAAAKWTVAGTSMPKVDGRAFVTGTHQYASDVRRPGMLFGKVLRPPALQSKLVSANTKEAEAKARREGRSRRRLRRRCRAERARRGGSADTHQGRVANRPASLSEGSVQTLEGEGAPGRQGRLWRRRRAGFNRRGIEGRRQDRESDVHDRLHRARSARTAGRRRGVERRQAHGLDRHADAVSRARRCRTRARRRPTTKCGVIVPDMGSGYGGKHNNDAAIEAARLAKAAGKPVKIVWTREEEFTWAYFRPAGVIEVNAGMKKDGTLTAWEFHNYNSGASAIRTPYAVPNVKTEFHASDSPLKQGSYRALASTANCFARESVMDELAHAVEIDPLEFRLKNLKEPRLRAVLEAAAKKFGWGKEKSTAGARLRPRLRDRERELRRHLRRGGDRSGERAECRSFGSSRRSSAARS